MYLTFNPEHVASLLRTSISAQHRVPCLSQMVDASLWRQDLPRERISALSEEAREHGYALSIRRDEIDEGLVPAGLWIVGDRGVYLTSDAPIDDMRAAGVCAVAYAHEADPYQVEREVWVRAKHASFGSDDGVEFLPAAAVMTGLNPAEPYRIFLTADRLILPVVTPDRRAGLGAPFSPVSHPSP